MCKSRKIPTLFGLLLAGGKSSRMGRDKSLLRYHKKSQVRQGMFLLEQVCVRVFISNRKDQNRLAEHQRYDQIHDLYHDLGPLGGILSAMSEYPTVAWLVVACDLPFLAKKDLTFLVQSRDPLKFATAYQDKSMRGVPEPLCAIYEPAIQNQLLSYLEKGVTCPRAILKELDVRLINLLSQASLDNINSLEDYQRVIDKF